MYTMLYYAYFQHITTGCYLIICIYRFVCDKNLLTKCLQMIYQCKKCAFTKSHTKSLAVIICNLRCDFKYKNILHVWERLMYKTCFMNTKYIMLDIRKLLSKMKRTLPVWFYQLIPAIVTLFCHGLMFGRLDYNSTLM